MFMLQANVLDMLLAGSLQSLIFIVNEHEWYNHKVHIEAPDRRK